MAFASPLLWWPVAFAGLGVVLLHLWSWRRPKPRLLPTARFVPLASQPSRFRRIEPSDLALLMLRLAALAALGAAAAGPLAHWRRDGLARVLVVDRSRAVARLQEGAAAAESLASGTAALRVVAFDSVPQSISLASLVADTVRREVPGHLGAALVAAVREANDLRAQFDSVDVVLISPLVEEAVDLAVPMIAASSGVAIRLHRTTASTVDAPELPPAPVLPDESDGIAAAAWVAWGAAPAHLRLSRSGLTAGDSAFARGGGAVVTWPRDTGRSDVVAGLVAGRHAVVGPLSPRDAPLPGVPVAHWHDGRVAATEERLGAGCIRHVGVQVAARGDLTLRPAFTALVRELTAPCALPNLAPADPSILRATDGAGGRIAALAPDVRLQRVLAALALLALGLEMWVRRSRRGATRVLASRAPEVREAA